MPAMPEGASEGILKGLYKLKASDKTRWTRRAHLLGSGAILNEAFKAQQILESYEVAADVWSVTSYKELRRDGLDAERWNLLHPESEPRVSYVTQCFANDPGVLVAASDYLKVLPDSIGRWCPRPFISLGTDGFGRSDSRSALRNFFEVDARFIALGVLYGLMQEHKIDAKTVAAAMKELAIEPDKQDPMAS